MDTPKKTYKLGNMAHRDDVQAVLRETAERLAAMGVFARVEPADLSSGQDGLGALLMVGGEIESIARMHVLTEIGVTVGHSKDNMQFEQRVELAMNDAVFRAGTFGIELTAEEQREIDELGSVADNPGSSAPEKLLVR